MKGRDFLIMVFSLFAILLSWPILTIFNHSRLLFGIPLLVFYLFTVWAGIIAVLLASWTRRTDERS